MAHLPSIRLQDVSGPSRSIELSARDYLRFEGTDCQLLVAEGSVNEEIVLNAIHIQSWNTRYTNDGQIQACKTAMVSPLPSQSRVLKLFTRTVPVVYDHEEPETEGNTLQ